MKIYFAVALLVLMYLYLYLYVYLNLCYYMISSELFQHSDTAVCHSYISSAACSLIITMRHSYSTVIRGAVHHIGHSCD